MPPQPSPAAPPPRPPAQSNSLKILLILGIAAALCSCLVCGGFLALMVLAPSATPVNQPLSPAPNIPQAAAPASPEAPDDFIYKAPNGAQYIPDITIVARGTVVTLAGTWREDHQGFLLVLGADNSYRCENGGTAGRNAAVSIETGTWSLLNGKLRLIPTHLTLHAVSGLRQISEDQPVGPPRNLSAEGLALQYVPYNTPAAPPRKLDGLAIEGDAPAWDYTLSGKWKFTLRRAPE